jgi:23S rRNA pseudouridine1911/1915/1917 synthase
VALNLGWSYRRPVRPHEAGVTLVAHLAATHVHSNEATWLTRVRSGEVELDGHTARPDAIVRAGQAVVWHRPPWDEPDVPLSFDVLYEDDALLAVAKPSGLPTLPAGGFLAHTLLTCVRARYPDASPVHRLGRFTSGVVLCARSPMVAAAIARQWHTAAVEKTYRALLAGSPTWDHQHVKAPIGPVPHPRLRTVYAASASGRSAESVFDVRARSGDATWCDVRITTGRPHQIRIHAAWTGHPLAGDPLYAGGGMPKALAPGLPGDGGYLLHARRLSLRHPLTRGSLTVTAPLPAGLRLTDDSSSRR